MRESTDSLSVDAIPRQEIILSRPLVVVPNTTGQSFRTLRHPNDGGSDMRGNYRLVGLLGLVAFSGSAAARDDIRVSDYVIHTATIAPYPFTESDVISYLYAVMFDARRCDWFGLRHCK
jgi:hypothetical protein